MRALPGKLAASHSLEPFSAQSTVRNLLQHHLKSLLPPSARHCGPAARAELPSMNLSMPSVAPWRRGNCSWQPACALAPQLGNAALVPARRETTQQRLFEERGGRQLRPYQGERPHRGYGRVRCRSHIRHLHLRCCLCSWRCCCCERCCYRVSLPTQGAASDGLSSKPLPIYCPCHRHCPERHHRNHRLLDRLCRCSRPRHWPRQSCCYHNVPPKARWPVESSLRRL